MKGKTAVQSLILGLACVVLSSISFAQAPNDNPSVTA
jgi:hypothetical protein